MIRYHAPSNLSADFGFAIHATDHSLGPFNPDGTPFIETLEFRSALDRMEEKTGIYGENHVSHRQADGDIWFDIAAGLENQGVDQIRMSSRWLDGSVESSRTVDTATLKYQPATPNWEGDYYLVARTPLRMTHVRLFVTSEDSKSVTISHAYVSSRRYLGPGDARVLAIAVEVASRTTFPASLTLEKSSLWKQKAANHFVQLMDELGPDRVQKTTMAIYFPDKGIASQLDIPSPGFVSRSVDRYVDGDFEIPKEIKSFGELTAPAIQTLDRNEVNMFEFIGGLKNPSSMIPKLKALKSLKTHASNFLAVEYALLPTIGDLQLIWDAINSSSEAYYDANNFRVLTAGDTKSKISHDGEAILTHRVKLAINPSDPFLKGMHQKLRDLGGFPSVDNLWELVPFSFVVDWFINIGDFLENLDTRFRLANLDVKFATTSSKLTIIPKTSNLKAVGLYGSVKIVYYDRSVSELPPQPPLNFEVSNELPNHWLEAGALIVVTRK